MAQKGAPTVAGTSQNWTQNASQSTQNPLQKCTVQPDIHTGNAKIADFIAVENQMKIWIIKSHVFHFPVCVSGSNGRPRRPKNIENWSKDSTFFSRTVSGPQLGCPDELEDNLMRVWKLRSSSTTSEQQRSTIRSHRTSVFNFCVPRRRHPRQVEPYLTVIWKTVQGESGPFLENASHLWSAYFLSTPDELRDDWRRVWKLRSRLITSRRHPACIPYNFSPENAIPKTSATSSKVPRRLPLSKIRVAHGRPNFCFQSLYEMSTQWWPF